MIKRATLTTAVAVALAKHGVPEPSAALAAELKITVFYVAFSRWINESADREPIDVVCEGFEES